MSEYVDDVPYVRQFVSELSPTMLRLVAGSSGLAPPPGDDFDYCELGCGHGDTLCALAAAHPESRFLGVDLSTAHIASAKRLARDGALENVGFLERDFGDLLEEDLGELDYVTAHGVLTWVSPEKRRQLIAFARQKLKPGGLLFVSYNAMPGWASVEPLRQLLVSAPGGAPLTTEATTLERARHGLAFAQAMQRAGADYFEKNPSAGRMLATMDRVGLPYVVHEYFHEHWTPMYFARVAWEMSEQELSFVGALPLFSNFPETAISEDVARVFENITDRVTFESFKDFATNQFFRCDVFVKGSLPRSSEARREATNAYLDATPFGPSPHEAIQDTQVRLPHRTIDLAGPTFDALRTALGEGGTTLDVLASRTKLDRDELRKAIHSMLVADRVVPLRASTRAAPATLEARYELPSPYNQLMLRRLSSETPLVMASSTAGTALPVSALDVLALRALTEAGPAERAGWIRDLVGRSVMRLRVGDRVLDDREEQRAAIASAVTRLGAERLATLVDLGVLRRVAG
ncbi:MAG: class I SAM-dependent methyltransferase [Labilithrix sp.]|nr:class I SAM-dependent methyltransferase [Labilithrix sp.]